MYRKVGKSTTGPENFEIPFNGQLSPENRWIIMASLIPWEEFEIGSTVGWISSLLASGKEVVTALLANKYEIGYKI